MSPCFEDVVVHGHESQCAIAIKGFVDLLLGLGLQLHGLGSSHGEGGYYYSAEHFVLFYFL